MPQRSWLLLLFWGKAAILEALSAFSECVIKFSLHICTHHRAFCIYSGNAWLLRLMHATLHRAQNANIPSLYQKYAYWIAEENWFQEMIQIRYASLCSSLSSFFQPPSVFLLVAITRSSDSLISESWDARERNYEVGVQREHGALRNTVKKWKKKINLQQEVEKREFGRGM